MYMDMDKYNVCVVTCKQGATTKEVHVERGTSLLRALRSMGIVLDAGCGGLGKCGRCKVMTDGILGRPSQIEMKHLGEELDEGWRLACQATVEGDVDVYVDILDVGGKARFVDVNGDAFGQISPSVVKEKIDIDLDDKGATSLRDLICSILGKPHLSFRPEALADISALLSDIGTICAYLVTIDDQCIAAFPENYDKSAYGFVCDLGTTTLSMALVDLSSGKVVSGYTKTNPQKSYGADVISRISAALSSEGLHEMRSVLLESISEMMRHCLKEAKVNKKDVFELLVLGNTVMEHIFWGISPKSFARSPYLPVFTDGLTSEASNFPGLLMHPLGRVRTVPAIARFVGGDMTALLFELMSLNPKLPSLVIDLGTNGEIGLVLNDAIFVTSAAAGPAFEGGAISCGMPATDGAIYALHWDEKYGLKPMVLGNTKPKGMCGSGIISALALFIRLGLIEESGRIKDPESIKDETLLSKIKIEDEKNERKIIIAEDVALTQWDIRQLQLAKGAIYAAVEILTEEAGLNADALNAIYLAGSFGSCLNPKDVMDIRLLPKAFKGEVVALGNGALKGGLRLLLKGRKAFEDVDPMLSKVRYVDIEERGFSQRFLASLFFR
ncbi:ASKHA domain-containing protein [Acetomicrobium flavidum]|uniref:ASKHA domain-containing protein n=2 Tax=Acetomicrobium flavidum TaxID=49896 RepID=UPI00345FE709